MFLPDIIRNECLPQRDCMLTVQDAQGETGFLYFKDAELIEANCAALWGKEALAEIMKWQLAESTVAALPLGIKRSLWDPLDNLINPDLAGQQGGASAGASPSFSAARVQASAPTPYDQFKELPGVTKLVFIDKNKHQVVFEAPGEAPQRTEWIMDFIVKCRAIGDTLGFGKLDQWSLTSDRYHMVGLKFENGMLAVLRKHETGLDDFEAACQASMRSR
jgi:hypothetical protein